MTAACKLYTLTKQIHLLSEIVSMKYFLLRISELEKVWRHDSLQYFSQQQLGVIKSGTGAHRK